VRVLIIVLGVAMLFAANLLAMFRQIPFYLPFLKTLLAAAATILQAEFVLEE